MKRISRVSSFLALIAGLVTLVLSIEKSIVIFSLAFLSVLIFTLWLIFSESILPFRRLKKGLKLMQQRISEAHRKPDLIVAFDRGSGILACMLAQKMRIGEVIVLDRRVKEDGEVIVGDISTLNNDKLDNRDVVVAKFHLASGRSLHKGLALLKQAGLKKEPLVFCLYITPSARKMNEWKRVEWIYLHSDIYQTLGGLPWISTSYDIR